MASQAPPDSATQGRISRKLLGLVSNTVKHNHYFIQFFAMIGVLLLSLKSLGHKYRIHDLQEGTSALKEEQASLPDRMNKIKSSLRKEASLESTGLFVARLRLLFGDDA